MLNYTAANKTGGAVHESLCYTFGQIRGEREFPFPVIPKNGGLWFPFPNFGNGFFHSLPVPEFRECLFSFPSRSQILGMDFFHSIPVPELWEWKFFIPFPFPN